MHLNARYGVAISSRHGRRMLTRLGVPRASDGERFRRAPSPAVAIPASDVAAQSARSVISDQERKQLALRRMRRLCSSGLPLAPLISGIFDLVQQALPNSENKVFLAGSGENPSRYLMNNPELAKWTAIHKHYYIDAPSSISGLRIRFAEPYLAELFAKVAGTSEDFALPHFRRSEGYNEFLRPLGFDHMLWVTFADHGERLGLYPIWRSADMRSFSSDDMKFVRLAAAHIAHALKVANLHGGGEFVSADDFLANAKHGIGAVILDERGRVIGANKEAEAVFAEMAIAGGHHPGLLAPDRAHELFSYLARLLDRIFRDSTCDSVLGVPAVRFYCHSTGIALKMSGIITHGSEGRRYITVLTERGELRTHRRTRLGATFGLSGTDIVVLGGLRNGLTNAQLAAKMGVAPDTVKTYVRRLGEKLAPDQGAAQARVFARTSWA